MAFSQDLTGQQFGSYHLVRRLGVGGFASVYLGQHVRISSKQAAIKILHLFDVDVQQFQQEAETTEQLRHPHIVRLLDFDVQEGTPFLVLDYAPGGSLRTRHPKGSQVPLATVNQYLKELAPALQHAHDRGILHRDIKPDNILIGEQGELLLSDFGIALLSRTGRTSVQGPTNTGGTPYYMAPEQFRGRPTKASDQYALAIVVYEWLCGSVPFREGDWIELGYQHVHESVPKLSASVPTLPESVEAVVMKALSKQPQDRFSSIQAFSQALEKVCQQPVEAPAIISPSDQRPEHADQLVSMEAEATTQVSSSSTTAAAEVPPSSRPLTPIPVSYPTQYQRAPNWRVLFTLILVLLVTLSGGSLYYFGFITQRTLPLSPAQATATAAAQAYATGTTKQGVMFGFDASHTRNNPYERTLSPANVSRLKLLWSFATEDSINSSPAVAGGMVYVGSDDYKLYAFDASCRKDCQPLWSYPTKGRIWSTPAVVSGMVYVGSYDWNLYAFDASCRKDCQPLWSFRAGNVIESSPVVAGGMVYVGSWDSSLYTFDASCRSACQPLWSYPTGGTIRSSPVVADGIVYIGSDDHKLYAFDSSCRKDCQPLWTSPTEYTIASSPAVAGGMVYVGSYDGKLYAFDASCRKDCQPLWTFPTGTTRSSPVVADGIVYIGSDNGKLYAFDSSCRSACQPLWTFSTEDRIESSPSAADSTVYIGSWDSWLYTFDASCRSACQPLWKYRTEGEIYSSPAIANGIVYVGSRDHKLYAFGLGA